MHKRYFSLMIVIGVSVPQVVSVVSPLLAAQPDVRDVPAADHRLQLIKRHRLMSDIHARMSRCLELGKSHALCHREILDQCSNHLGEACSGFTEPRGDGGVRRLHQGCFWLNLPQDVEAPTTKSDKLK